MRMAYFSRGRLESKIAYLTDRKHVSFKTWTSRKEGAWTAAVFDWASVSTLTQVGYVRIEMLTTNEIVAQCSRVPPTRSSSTVSVHAAS